MPETPDFDAIALRLTAAVAVLPIPLEAAHALVTEVREQLRLVWNARGAADVARVDATLPLLYLDQRNLDGWIAKHLDQALRKLDR